MRRAPFRARRHRPRSIVVGSAGNGGNRSEYAMSLTGGARREIERVGTRCFPAAQGQGPQSVDHQWLTIGALQLIDETPVLVEYVDSAVAEVADEDVAAESAEGIRRPRDTPGRIERPATDQA